MNIASVVGLDGKRGTGELLGFKRRSDSPDKNSAREFSSRNILVNAIAPGFIRTAMTDALNDEAKKKLSEQIPLGRLGEAEDVAKVALFLAAKIRRI